MTSATEETVEKKIPVDEPEPKEADDKEEDEDDDGKDEKPKS